MKVAITGATGMIGSALSKSLQADGHEVIAISRHAGEGVAQWNLEKGTLEVDKLAGCKAIVNLAGSSIAQRWTREVKQEIVDSRVKGTQLIAEAAAKLDPRPTVLVSASAIGIYGANPGQPVDESTSAGKGFLADVCVQWEAATAPAEAAGIRVVHPRIGVVLSPDGGALAKMLTPFRAGLGGPIGNGKQMVSWISLDDLVRALRFLIEHDSLSGPVNLTAPGPVSNADFAKALAKTLDKPCALPAPAFALKLAMGEMVDETVLADQTVLPKRLEEAGFSFAHTDITEALKHSLG